jgi:molybdopterin synthase catalytic subunit
MDKRLQTIICSLHEDVLPSVDELSQKLLFPSCGAVSAFVGVTRDFFGDKKVTHLFYECYEAMAKSEMLKICQEVDKQVLGIAICHRVGLVPIGEASVVIVAVSSHRKAAIDAVSNAIDLLKARVPIWKKEFYDDGTDAIWKVNPECR